MVKNAFKVATFAGGIHPVFDGKKFSFNKPIRVAPLFEKYYIPVQQNIGAPPKVVATVGQEVKKGDLIAEANGFVSVPLHAPTSGVIEAINKQPGPMGTLVDSIILKADGKDEWGTLLPHLDWREESADTLKNRIREAGIVGMGGAAFPTAVKLSPPEDKKITTLIINGAECEPYLTADHRLLLEATEKVLIGAAIMGKILNIRDIYIGVELNKTDAINILIEKAKPYEINIIGLKVQYPQGAEKQLIYAVTQRKVPNGGLPMDSGVVVQNAGTACAVFEAVTEGKPLIERITTVTGEAITNAGNWRVKIGTRAEDLVKSVGGVNCEPKKIIMGGPMMGFAQKSLDIAIQKNSSGLLLLNNAPQYQSTHCIRCGRCLNACPMNLNPSLLGTFIESEKFDDAKKINLMDCMECGACAYICPAHRPLVQHIRRAKAEIRNQQKK